MILNIRGTSGSGKTHIVNELVRLYDAMIPVYNNDRDDVLQYGGPFRLPKQRKQPLYYLLRKIEGDEVRTTALLGHYERACGGCDTISSLDTIFGLAREFAEAGQDVIFEGLLVSAEFNRSDALFGNFPHTVLRLATPMDDCVASVQSRRDARGDERPLNPKNTLLKDKAIISTVRKLQANGRQVIFADRTEAMFYARSALNV
jgi:hypothetical protein